MHRRRKHILFILVSLFILFLFGCDIRDNTPPHYSAEELLLKPGKTNLKISPSGKYISFLGKLSGVKNVFVINLKSNDTIKITNSTDNDISGYMWIGEEKIVYQKTVNDENNTKLFSNDLKSGNDKQLSPPGNSTDMIIDPLKNQPNELIIRSNELNENAFDVFRINIRTGERKLILKNPGNITFWLTDHEGKLRIAVNSDGVNHGILYRKNESDELKLASVTNFKEHLRPLTFDFDNKYVFMISNIGRDKSAIVKYDIENNKELEVIYQHHEVDVEDLIISKRRKKILGVSYTTWKSEYKFFDEETKLLMKTLKKRLLGKEIQLVDYSEDERKILIRTLCDRCRGEYYYYNKDAETLEKLTDYNKNIKKEHMAKMKPVRYKARDGVTITGYLTLPVGIEHNNLPVIINPHGGPWLRDSWGFSSRVQFLANRGYAVLQINYRGSTGFGREFWESGFKEWGKKMQDDITDGVHWLVNQQIADPQKVAIIGASYGGYAALAGLTLTPDLYACGASLSGIADLVAFLNSIPPQWEPFKGMLYESIGNPNTEEDKLKAVSPFYNIGNITSPVFFAHGAKDRMAPVETIKIMVEKLEEKGVQCEFMVMKNENHGIRNESNRIEYYKKLESFLEKYLERESY